jgi:hypothetical protein
MVRIKILRYHRYDNLFTVMADYNFSRSIVPEDCEFKMDAFELGLCHFPDEDHNVTEKDYESMVGAEFDIESWDFKVHALALKDARRAKVIPIGDEKWTYKLEACGRCGSEFCECKDYISQTDWDAEQIRLEYERAEERREYEERMAPIWEQERIDKAYQEFLTTQQNKKAMAR